MCCHKATECLLTCTWEYAGTVIPLALCYRTWRAPGVLFILTGPSRTYPSLSFAPATLPHVNISMRQSTWLRSRSVLKIRQQATAECAEIATSRCHSLSHCSPGWTMPETICEGVGSAITVDLDWFSTSCWDLKVHLSLSWRFAALLLLKMYTSMTALSSVTTSDSNTLAIWGYASHNVPHAT